MQSVILPVWRNVGLKKEETNRIKEAIPGNWLKEVEITKSLSDRPMNNEMRQIKFWYQEIKMKSRVQGMKDDV